MLDHSRSGILWVSGLSRLLHPILDASHTRNRRTSPPNSSCLPGTRTEVIRKISCWATASLSDQPQHILWVFGYAGCGKSAIAQAAADLLAEARRLGASFFFFRGSGDRTRITRLAPTIASQIAATIPGTEQLIATALRTYPGLLEPTTSPLFQFKHLVYDPIRVAAWSSHRPHEGFKTFIIIIDGLDECEDKEEVAEFVWDLIAFFQQNPNTPLRFLVTSRVEEHLHRRLHNSEQVCLLNLVHQTSDKDIAAALDALIEDARRSRVFSTTNEWLSPENKQALVHHIGGSFIFLGTIMKFLFDQDCTDGLSPFERLPVALNMDPGFDSMYSEILGRSCHLPHFFPILNTVALSQQPLSIAVVADLVDISVVSVTSILVRLHSILQVPGDDFTPITLWHTSFRDFLCSERRSGSLFSSPSHHRRLAYQCISLTARSIHCRSSASVEYA
ncbi:hypothetical protein FA13DRAFT_1910180, partial [Coprinellus micaceus]